ncbi:sensor histidine kinase [Frankia sp. Cas3]|uniref:sensor histidine kinase n=1 Tax=Frankia sp. Cas3 TaxID=3073926 RepID=UPI002AD53167|nr:sensor histidine kinase [Frankia sp. Cas3]
MEPPEPPEPPLHKRLKPGHWIAIDCAVAALGVPAATLLAPERAGSHQSNWAGAGIVVLLLAVGLRRCWPRAVLALIVVAGAVAVAISTSAVPWLAVAYVMYLVPLRFARREALWLLAGTLAMTAVGHASFRHLAYLRSVPNGVGTLVESALLITVAWTIGYAVRQQRRYAAGLREQAEHQAREQLAEARRAMSEERLRIARELHDVVAHTLSVIAVQAGVANHVAAEHPIEARRALSSIEDVSRDALREMRALLGVLRDEAHPGASARQGDGSVPAPRLADLGTLVERAAKAGVQVDLTISGERPKLSAGLEMAAYRVVQEAITNVVKHAATDRCQVSIAYQPDGLRVEVTDDGRGADGTPDGHGVDGGRVAGHGVAGMRERVGMYGGELRSGPLPGRGFRVAARFPLTTPAAL